MEEMEEKIPEFQFLIEFLTRKGRLYSFAVILLVWLTPQWEPAEWAGSARVTPELVYLSEYSITSNFPGMNSAVTGLVAKYRKTFWIL